MTKGDLIPALIVVLISIAGAACKTSYRYIAADGSVEEFKTYGDWGTFRPGDRLTDEDIAVTPPPDFGGFPEVSGRSALTTVSNPQISWNMASGASFSADKVDHSSPSKVTGQTIGDVTTKVALLLGWWKAWDVAEARNAADAAIDQAKIKAGVAETAITTDAAVDEALIRAGDLSP